MKWEISWLRQAGFNVMRKHIKGAGALLLSLRQTRDGGVAGHARRDAGEPVRLPVSREQYELELRRMIGRLYNAPSVVMWGVNNEGWGQYESKPLAQGVKSIDPSRLTNSNSGWLAQVHQGGSGGIAGTEWASDRRQVIQGGTTSLPPAASQPLSLRE